jgi:hypothetical protein
MASTYCQTTDVQKYLCISTAFSGSTNPTSTQVDALINQNEDRIDRLTNHAWRPRKSGTETANDATPQYEYYDAPDVYDLTEGAKIYLRHRKILPLNSLAETIDACEATTGWTASGSNSVATTTTYTTQGTYALTLVKSDTSSATCSVSKATTATDFTGKTFQASVYISETLFSSLLATGTAVEVRFGSASNAYYYKTLSKNNLSAGWNTISFTSTTATGSSGTPTITACDYTYLAFVTSAASGTSAADGFIFDDLKMTTDALEIWDGNAYTDYLASKEEGRASDYWLNYEKGILYIYDIPSTDRDAIRMKYRYGDQSVPDDIKKACTLMTAIDILRTEDRSFLLPEGGASVNYSSKIELMEAEIKSIIEQRSEWRYMMRS